ncbi:zinc ribbon domain-containing protein [uncultured Thiohalocapsa sp.]|uniref:FmdB family zinc ribbon protein n=1 Tax=uncultured Thiohalocapsa sp. TaxID=768990 RepID=UPI0034598E99
MAPAGATARPLETDPGGHLVPRYDYRCQQCQHAFEASHALAAQAPPCPHCGGATRKTLLSAPAVHGVMAQGRERAVQSLTPAASAPGHRHGPNCGCAQH